MRNKAKVNEVHLAEMRKFIKYGVGMMSEEEEDDLARAAQTI